MQEAVKLADEVAQDLAAVAAKAASAELKPVFEDAAIKPTPIHRQLIRKGELFPIKGVWCRMVGFDPENNWIVLEPVGPTSKARKAALRAQGA